MEITTGGSVVGDLFLQDVCAWLGIHLAYLIIPYKSIFFWRAEGCCPCTQFTTTNLIIDDLANLNLQISSYHALNICVNVYFLTTWIWEKIKKVKIWELSDITTWKIKSLK